MLTEEGKCISSLFYTLVNAASRGDAAADSNISYRIFFHSLWVYYKDENHPEFTTPETIIPLFTLVHRKHCNDMKSDKIHLPRFTEIAKFVLNGKLDKDLDEACDKLRSAYTRANSEILALVSKTGIPRNSSERKVSDLNSRRMDEILTPSQHKENIDSCRVLGPPSKKQKLSLVLLVRSLIPPNYP
jgi:hypothetical protein